MTAAVPLIRHTSPASVLAYCGGKPVTAAEFLADATRLAGLLPSGGHVLNDCADRYRFAVGLAAGIISKCTSLLPPTRLPEIVRRLREFAPETVCLTDHSTHASNIPTVQFPTDPPPPLEVWNVPCIATEQRVAYIFTSGSTGHPVPHAKTWGRVVASVQVEGLRLGLDGRKSYAMVATVPPQHMFGFESSVLLALHSGNAICAERPFFPADIVRVLSSVPSPRVFVSTPIHLRALLAADLPLPEVWRVVCATAPLEPKLAAAVEARFSAPLLEIYGSTETGQLASRRPTASAEWQLWPDVVLYSREGRTWAEGGHVEMATPLGDVIEQTSASSFILHGRTEDLINIAGNRSSLAYLNHQLTAVPGVVDGVFYFGDHSGDHSITGTARLTAIVVAPGLRADDIMRELRLRIDPVFLPRPLIIVERIPRNSTGKVSLSALEALSYKPEV
jgi:acyl-coenzyme A synthetase/AMP-(fatty) acid ligase